VATSDHPPGRAVENSAISQEQASEVYFNDETFESYELQDRYALETILKEHQFFWRLDESMTQLLQQARRQGLEVSDMLFCWSAARYKCQPCRLGAVF